MLWPEAVLASTAREIPWSSEEAERLAGAIQDPTRRKILLAFYQREEPVTVDQVAKAAGIHRSVAFTHLERLAALGYLTVTQRRGFAGKPAKLYQRSSDRPIQFGFPARQPGLLAKMLIEALAGCGATGAAAAREAGRRWGAILGARGRTPAEVLDSAEFLGADYEVRGDTIVARNCIFHEACQLDRAIVCGVHGGLIEGMLSAAGMSFDARPLDETQPTCAFRLTSHS